MMATNQGRRMPTPASTILDNPADMYYIRKENAYNQKIKDALNNDDLLILPGINKNKKNHIYLGEIRGGTLRIIDPYNNKKWGIVGGFSTFNNGWHDNLKLAKIKSDKYKGLDRSLWDTIRESFKDLENEDGVTIQDLFDKYPDGTIFDDNTKPLNKQTRRKAKSVVSTRRFK